MFSRFNKSRWEYNEKRDDNNWRWSILVLWKFERYILQNLYTSRSILFRMILMMQESEIKLHHLWLRTGRKERWRLFKSNFYFSLSLSEPIKRRHPTVYQFDWLSVNSSIRFVQFVEFNFSLLWPESFTYKKDWFRPWQWKFFVANRFTNIKINNVSLMDSNHFIDFLLVPPSIHHPSFI